jgi:hypothetical protein
VDIRFREELKREIWRDMMQGLLFVPLYYSLKLGIELP